MSRPRITVLEVTVAYERNGQLEHTQLAACFDAVTTQAMAQGVGRQIGSALGDALALKLQQRVSLAA